MKRFYKDEKLIKINIFLFFALILAFFISTIVLTKFRYLGNELNPNNKRETKLINNDEASSQDFWVYDKSWYTKTKGYTNSEHPFNVYSYSQNSSNLVMDFNKNKDDALKFNDNGDDSDLNETNYLPIVRIYFAPNVDYVDATSVSFEIEDHYREVGTWGEEHKKTKTPNEHVNLLIDSKFTSYGGHEISNSRDELGEHTYNDYIYNCLFGKNEESWALFPFRFMYTDNTIGAS